MKVITTNLLNRFWKNGVKPIKDMVAGKLDASKVVQSTNITQAGMVMDGKTTSEALSELNSNLSQAILVEEKSLTGSGVSYMYLPDKPGYVLANVYCYADNFLSVEVRAIRQNANSKTYTILFTANVANGANYAMRFVWIKNL